MSSTTLPIAAQRAALNPRKLLAGSATAWAGVAIAGQLLFGAYVIALYGGALLTGHPERWNKVMTQAYTPGDWLSNALSASHLLFTVLVVIGGALQLLPALRRRLPAFHRWSGRLYVSSAALLAAGGLTLLWTRGSVGDLTQHLGTSMNGLLVIGFALLAWRAARAGQFDAHRRWALRLWLTVSGVWFFRIGLMLWIGVHQGAVGFDGKTFTGPFLSFLAFAQTLLPLALLQAYFVAQASRRGALAAGRGGAAGAGGAAHRGRHCRCQFDDVVAGYRGAMNPLPGAPARAFVPWPRLRSTLIIATVLFLLLQFAWESSKPSLALRIYGLSLALMGVFSVFERWPRRLPPRLARWVLQVLAVGLAVPPLVFAIYWFSTEPGAPPFWKVEKRATGFGLMIFLGILIAPWTALAALVRQREAWAEDQARQAMEARQRLARAQVQPHFLFNTLANVQALVEAGSPRAAQLLQAFDVAYLRCRSAASGRRGSAHLGPRAGAGARLPGADADAHARPAAVQRCTPSPARQRTAGARQ